MRRAWLSPRRRGRSPPGTPRRPNIQRRSGALQHPGRLRPFPPGAAAGRRARRRAHPERSHDGAARRESNCPLAVTPMTSVLPAMSLDSDMGFGSEASWTASCAPRAREITAGRPSPQLGCSIATSGSTAPRASPGSGPPALALLPSGSHRGPLRLRTRRLRPLADFVPHRTR